MTTYAERDEVAYTRFTKKGGRLLREKGGGFQRAFLAAAKDRRAFIDFMEREVPVEDGDRPPAFDGAMTEQSFKDMTVDQEEAVHGLWKEVPPRTACRVSFWAETTIQHLKDGVIEEASWLAANGGRTESGEERIDRALAERGDQGQKPMDDCVRTILRRMSGLPSARGNRSVFVDPPFARAWWRERLVSRIANRDGAEARADLSKVVRRSQTYWENLMTMIVSRGSVFGSMVAQDAFINGLARNFRVYPQSPLRNTETLKSALRRFSNVAAARELGVLTFEEIGEIVETLLAELSRSHAAQDG